MVKQSLLLVDGDPKSLRVLDVSLKKAGFDVVAATNGAEALARMEERTPDLVISDTVMPEMDGFELCRRMKERGDWAKIPIIFLTSRKSIEEKIRGLELGVEDYLTKPIYIKEITTRVRILLQRQQRERLESRRGDGRTKFAGQLADIGLVDLVQTIELNRKSGIIHIQNRDGRRGAVYFRDGRVIDAEVGRLSGADAVYRLFSWSEGTFEVEFKPIRRRDVVALSPQALLMEGMRRLDEWTRLLDGLPPMDAVFEVDFHALAERLADIPDEVNGILRLFDGRRSFTQVLDDCDFPDLEALTVVRKLFGDGIIHPLDRRDLEPEAARPAPSASGRLERWLEDEAARRAETNRDAAASREAVHESPTSRMPGAVVESVPTPAPEQAFASADAATRPGTPSAVAAQLDEPYSLERRGTSPYGVPQVDGEPVAPGLLEAKTPLVEAAEVEPSRPTKEGRAAAGEPAAAPDPEALDGETLRGFQAVGDAGEVEGAEERRAAAVGAVSDGSSGLDRAEPTARLRPPPQLTLIKNDSAEDATPTPIPDTGAEDGRLDTREVEGDERVTEASPEEAADADTDEPVPVPRSNGDFRLPLESFPENQPGSGGTTLIYPAASEEAQDAAPAAAETSAETRPTRYEPPSGSEDLSALQEVPLWRRSAAVLGAVAFGGLLALGLYRAGLLPWKPVADETLATAAQEATPPAEPSPARTAQPAGSPAAAQPAPSGAAPQLPPVELPAPKVAQPAAKSPGLTPAVAKVESPVSKVDAPPPAPAKATESVPNPGAAPPAEPAFEELVSACRAANERERYRVVLSACGKALAQKPDAAEAAELMGMVANAELDRGHPDEALRWAKKAVAREPNHAEAYVVIGGAEQTRGKTREARAAYKRYLELAPSGRYAAELRAIVQNLGD